MTQVGVNVRLLRERQGIRQNELARRVDVTQSMISQVESGSKQPSVDMLVRLADVLGVSTDELLRGEPVPDVA